MYEVVIRKGIDTEGLVEVRFVTCARGDKCTGYSRGGCTV